MNQERIDTIMLWSTIMLILFFVIAGAYGWSKEWASLVIGTMGALFTGTAALASAYSAKMASKSANQWREIKRIDQLTGLLRDNIRNCQESRKIIGIVTHYLDEIEKKYDADDISEATKEGVGAEVFSVIKSDRINEVAFYTQEISFNQDLIELAIAHDVELIKEWKYSLRLMQDAYSELRKFSLAMKCQADVSEGDEILSRAKYVIKILDLGLDYIRAVSSATYDVHVLNR